MYDPKVEVYPYCWLSPQQSFKKQFRNTRSSCTSRHSLPYLPWRKQTQDGRDTISYLPEHLAQKGTELLGSCPAMCHCALGRARQQLCKNSWADAPRGDQRGCCKHQQKAQSSLRGRQSPAWTQSTGKEDKRNALFSSAYWITLFHISIIK